MAETAQKNDAAPETGRMPVPGDVISARYRWAEDPVGQPGKKIRPCMVVQVKADGSSMIIAPISTKPDWKAMDCLEVPPGERAAAGLTDDNRSFVKLTEINRFELPNLAIVPRTTESGRLAWTTGKVSDDILRRVQEEVAHRVHDGTLKGVRVAADNAPRLELAAVRKIAPQPEAPKDPLADRVTRAAQAMSDRLAASRADKSAARPRTPEHAER